MNNANIGRIIIVDDEPLARQRLEQLIAVISNWQCIGQASNTEAAHQLVISLRPDVVLLDINMPGETGLELARRYNNAKPAIIFTTAYEEYAVAAFECQAIDYLLKPIRQSRLEQALAKAQTQLSNHSDPRYISVRNSQQIEKLSLDSISCCLADEKYVRLVHDRGETLCDHSLTQLEQQYPDCFVRVHRKALVSRSRIIGLKRSSSGQWQVQLNQCDTHPEISRRHLDSLRKLLFS